ncbi:hypothetical protein C8J57DRAFT_1330322 [Mycena rebaudengoi]|nr:hypothetical protein C8J57DRAFT_1330322 [Mycena rebaudengoi]
MTGCTETPTHGNPLERCHIHHEQYRTVTKRYKEAKKFVDKTFAGALIPSKEDVLNYTSIPTIFRDICRTHSTTARVQRGEWKDHLSFTNDFQSSTSSS